MKYIILLALLIILVSCKKELNSKQENSETQTELQKKLKKTDLPIEVIDSQELEILYPKPYEESLVKYGKEYDVDPRFGTRHSAVELLLSDQRRGD